MYAALPLNKALCLPYGLSYGLLYSLLLAGLLTGCGNGNISQADILDKRKLLSVNGQNYTLGSLPGKFAGREMSLKNQLVHGLYRLAEDLAEKQILTAESEKRGLDRQQLFEEVLERKIRVSNYEITSYYSRFLKFFPGGLSDNRQKITNLLIDEKLDRVEGDVIRKLLPAYKVHFNIDLPRISLNYEDYTLYARKGQPGPAVIEFVDYFAEQLPRAEKLRRRIMNTPGLDIAWYLVHLPDPYYPPAWVLHRLSACAARKNAFADVHRILAENHDTLAVREAVSGEQQLVAAYDALFKTAMKYIMAAGLANAGAIEECARYPDLADTYLEKDLDLARNNDVRRAPFYIVNGVLREGPLAEHRLLMLLANTHGASAEGE